MITNRKTYRTMPLGVVLRRTPGVTRWAAWAWKAASEPAVLWRGPLSLL